jgi:hypothetical protein
MTDWAKQLTDHDWPKTDRTLSAAELEALMPDDLTLIAELLRRDAAGAAGVYMSPSDVRHEAARLLDMLAAVLPMARRTEAAERKLARVETLIAGIPADDPYSAVCGTDIRRALAED